MTLRIAVVGAGRIGGTVGRKWVARGDRVVFGLRDPEGERAAALGADLGGRAQVATLGDAIAGADVVLFAIPGAATAPTATEHAAALDGKIVIDATNRMGGSSANSVAEIRQVAPRANVFRAFNTYGFENLVDPVYDGVPGDQFYAGPEGEAQAIVEELIFAVGLRPVRLGGSDEADLVDSVLRLWFTLARAGHGRHLAFKVLTS